VLLLEHQSGFFQITTRDRGSKSVVLEGITVYTGGMQINDGPGRFETYADILTRHGRDELTIEGESGPPARRPRPA
jgi:hypothetical protein